MRTITIYLPELLLLGLEELIRKTGRSRSEFIRMAIKDLIEKELQIQRGSFNKFFNFCINCDVELHTHNRMNHYKYMNYEIFELKFCCSCFENFKNTSFDDLPESLLKKIQKKVKEYIDNQN